MEGGKDNRTSRSQGHKQSKGKGGSQRNGGGKAGGKSAKQSESGKGSNKPAKQSNGGKGGTPKKQGKGGKGSNRFPEYLPADQVQTLLEAGKLVQGPLRINSKRTQESYIKVEGVPHDLFIDGYVNRNRAFGGDIVAVKLTPRTQWRSRRGENVDLSTMPEDETEAELLAHAQTGELQAQGVVVRILEGPRSTIYIGTLVPHGANANFVPSDPAITRMFVPSAQCPADYQQQQRMYSCSFVQWSASDHLPQGELGEFVGEFGNIESETQALFVRHGVEAEPFDEAVLLELRERYPEGWRIPEEEIAKRRDLRSECIFAIDPPTAKDLDDALQCERLPNGNFKVGVHIADVSFFIEPNGILDKAAAARATSVYMCDRVIPMLPARLCEDLCSLNPDVDRCAFSVIWELSPQGEVLDEWFGRTVIRSCWKGAYPFAQKVIKGEEDPLAGCEITNGYDAAQCEDVIRDLWGLAHARRTARVEGGALTALHQVKLFFNLDENREPCGFSKYVTGEANHLVEEFMLLANQQTAAFIARQFPQIALLRNHEAPLEHGLEEVARFCAGHGIPMDTSSSKALEASLQEHLSDFHPHAQRVLTHMLTKPMQQANYFCTGDTEEDNWGHYALNMQRYTHFTSPIRRYPDLQVHRLLQQAINLAKASTPAEQLAARLTATCQPGVQKAVDQHFQDPESFEALDAVQHMTDARQKQLSSICVHCNEKKSNARKAQEGSIYVFLAVTLRAQPIEADAVVLGLGEKYMNLIAVGFDIEAKCYVDDCGPLLEKHLFDDQSKTLSLQWKKCASRDEQGAAGEGGGRTVELQVLSTVRVLLYTKENQVPLTIAMRLLPTPPHT